jgi:predicted nucleic acid-binding protein
MSYLLDTNILGRVANTRDVAWYNTTVNALLELHQRAETLHITPQVLIEFRNFATRPIAVNGLGLSVSIVEMKASFFESTYPLLDDTADIFPKWKMIVQRTAAVGKQVHDARLVAVCHAHNITHLLTFNTAHFARFASIPPGIVVVDPATV